MVRTFDRSDDLHEARFERVNLSGARIRRSDLSGLVIRGSSAEDIEIDDPWLLEQPGTKLTVNGVNVTPYVDAELNRRFPGRAERHADTPEGLRTAWAALEALWAATYDRAGRMPAGSVDISVAGEWSFAQTLRHLVLATDMWLGKAVLEKEQPFHPLGLLDLGSAGEVEKSVFSTETPSYDEVLAARADRVAMVRDFLARVTPDELAASHKNPHNPDFRETTLSCLHTIIDEEWEHLRYAVRDLDAIEQGGLIMPTTDPPTGP